MELHHGASSLSFIIELHHGASSWGFIIELHHGAGLKFIKLSNFSFPFSCSYTLYLNLLSSFYLQPYSTSNLISRLSAAVGDADDASEDVAQASGGAERWITGMGGWEGGWASSGDLAK